MNKKKYYSGNKTSHASESLEKALEEQEQEYRNRENTPEYQEFLATLSPHIPCKKFPDQVQQEAIYLAEHADVSPVCAIKKEDRTFISTIERTDLRDLPFVTIDGEDAKDFDDAICVLRQDAGWELWVAIADVSYFVEMGSALDKEARKRGNSFYFPTRVYPMLPEELSNGLCSLQPDENRLVMTVRMRFDSAGNTTGAVFFPGMIQSRARLTYTLVQHAFNAYDAGSTDSPLDADVLDMLLEARTLTRLLRAQRVTAGGLDFEIPEPEVILDTKKKRVLAIQNRERLESHRLIEDCMLAANEAVARWLTEKAMPFPYRVHPAPDMQRLDQLFTLLKTTELAPELLNRHNLESGLPLRLQKILAAAHSSPQEFLISRLVLRSMMRAQYAPEQDIHFGLASPCYCHFTSPIRRYADLDTHRALRRSLEKLEKRKRSSKTDAPTDASSANPPVKRRKPLPSGKRLLALCEQCNRQERVSVEAERDINKRMACLLMQNHEGERFNGIISGVQDFGIFVELEIMPIEGLVRAWTLDPAYDEYNSALQEIYCSFNKKKRLRIGQSVMVSLDNINIERGWINFDLIEEQEKPAKKAPKKKKQPKSAKK